MPEKRADEPEPPRLKIRKGAEQELHFHYSREERLSRPTAPPPIGPGEGFFRKNRTLIIIFGNVVLLAVLVFLFQRGGALAGDRARIGAYSLRLEAMRYQDAVYATVTARKEGKREAEGSPQPERMSVRFALEPGGEGLLQFAALPRNTGEQVRVGEAIPLLGDSEPKAIRAEIIIGDAVRSLRRVLGKS